MNKQQLFIIHGGDAFETYEDYLQSLKEKEVSLERMKQKDWKSNLQHDLGDKYDVYAPRFPNAQNARYEEWKIMFEKILPLMNDDLILIGHSLGGIFLAKYLSENSIAEKPRAVFFIAAPFSTKKHEPIPGFLLEKPLSTSGVLNTLEKNVFIYHSQDDIVVPFENAKLYSEALPNATLRTFTDRGHFNTEHFKEIEEDIRSVSR